MFRQKFRHHAARTALWFGNVAHPVGTCLRATGKGWPFRRLRHPWISHKSKGNKFEFVSPVAVTNGPTMAEERRRFMARERHKRLSERLRVIGGQFRVVLCTPHARRAILGVGTGHAHALTDSAHTVSLSLRASSRRNARIWSPRGCFLPCPRSKRISRAPSSTARPSVFVTRRQYL